MNRSFSWRLVPEQRIFMGLWALAGLVYFFIYGDRQFWWVPLLGICAGFAMGIHEKSAVADSTNAVREAGFAHISALLVMTDPGYKQFAFRSRAIDVLAAVGSAVLAIPYILAIRGNQARSAESAREALQPIITWAGGWAGYALTRCAVTFQSVRGLAARGTPETVRKSSNT